MNNKGFTLVELLATLVVLSIVIGISIAAMNFDFGFAKKKTEEVFIDTIKDAMEVYTSSDGRNLSFVLDTKSDGSVCTISKKRGDIKVYKAVTDFSKVINSKYKPITEKDLINPANEDVNCNVNATITIYRDEDFVYYYSIDKNDLRCLNNIGGEYDTLISNLPDSYGC